MIQIALFLPVEGVYFLINMSFKRLLERFPFVKTGRPDPSVCKENGTISRNSCMIIPRIVLEQYNREFKKRRRLRQRQRQKAVILLVKITKKIVLHVRHAFLNNSPPYSSKLLREMTNFKVFTTTWTNYSESFSLTLHFKSVPIRL